VPWRRPLDGAVWAHSIGLGCTYRMT